MSLSISRIARLMSNIVLQQNMDVKVRSSRKNDGIKFAAAMRVAMAALVVGVTAVSIIGYEKGGVPTADPIAWGKAHFTLDGASLGSHAMNELAKVEVNPDHVETILSCMKDRDFGDNLRLGKLMEKSSEAHLLAMEVESWARTTGRDVNMAIAAHCADPGVHFTQTIGRWDKKLASYASDSLIGEMAEKHLQADAVQVLLARAETMRAAAVQARLTNEEIYNDGYVPGSKLDGVQTVKVFDASGLAGLASSLGRLAGDSGMNSAAGSGAADTLRSAGGITRALGGGYGSSPLNAAAAVVDTARSGVRGLNDIGKEETRAAERAQRDAERKAESAARAAAKDPQAAQKNTVQYQECLKDAAEVNAQRVAQGKNPLKVDCVANPMQQSASDSRSPYSRVQGTYAERQAAARAAGQR